VSSLASGIDVPPENAEFSAVLNARWIHDVQLALDEIEERIQQDASLRALTGKFAAGVVDPLKSALPVAGLGGLSFAAGLDAWVGAAAIIGAAGAAPAVKAFQERRKAMRDIEKQPYYFLYKTEMTVRPRELR
jgi:ABC-type hemin transport system substrate-binding protein